MTDSTDIHSPSSAPTQPEASSEQARRKTASDFHPEVLRLFDAYVHGIIDRRAFIERAATREREIAIRTALGASRARLVRQLLTESLLLALMGGALGLLLAFWLVDVMVALSPAGTPRIDEVSIDMMVLGFTLVVAVFTGIVFGLVPALSSTRCTWTSASSG